MLVNFTEVENLIRRRKKMANPSDIDQIVQDILADMPLKEKAAIANLNEDKVHFGSDLGKMIVRL